MDITHITSLLGGVALFLYGMSIMGAGLEKLAGGKMQGVLQKLTSSTIKGVIFGTLITGVIQSSAGTVVICVGLVNSGIMTLTQSVGVIMGANIGTTVTGQLIRMADISGESLWLTLIQPKTFAPVVAFIGCIFYVFLRNASSTKCSTASRVLVPPSIWSPFPITKYRWLRTIGNACQRYSTG